MLIAAVATLASLTLLQPPAPTPAPHRPAAVRAPARAAAVPVGDLYAARAKRRMASYLRMRILELRKEGLRRASEVVEGKLGIDALLKAP